MPRIENLYQNQRVYLRIYVNNIPLPVSFYPNLHKVEVNHKRGKAHTASIYFKDHLYNIQDSGIFRLNSRIIIVGGWETNIITKGPFYITEIHPNFDSQNSPTIHYVLKDVSATKMSKRHKSRSFKGKKISEVFKLVAKEYKLNHDIKIDDDDDYKFSDEFSLTQSLEDDSRFLQRLADRIGYDLTIVNNVLVVEKPEIDRPYVRLNYRIKDRSIKEFRPNLKIQRMGKKTSAKVRSIDLDPLSNNEEWFHQIFDLNDGRVEFITQGDTNRVVGYNYKEVILEDDRPLMRVEVTGESIVKDKPFSAFIDGMEESEEVKKGLYPKRSNVIDSLAKNAGNVASTILDAKNRYVDPILRSAQDEGIIRIENIPQGPTNLSTKARVYIDGRTGRQTLGVTLEDLSENIQRENELPSIAKNEGLKLVRKAAPIEATLVPTIPSWEWFALESVFVDGVSNLCRGKYEVVEADLTIDNTNGMTTQLKLKKRTKGKKNNTKLNNDNIDNNDPRKNPVQNINYRVGVDGRTSYHVLIPEVE